MMLTQNLLKKFLQILFIFRTKNRETETMQSVLLRKNKITLIN